MITSEDSMIGPDSTWAKSEAGNSTAGGWATTGVRAMGRSKREFDGANAVGAGKLFLSLIVGRPVESGESGESGECCGVVSLATFVTTISDSKSF